MNQLVQVVRVLGTPSREDMVAMNRHYTELKFPNIRSQPLARWLSRMTERHIPSNAVDLLSKFFTYNPKQRITAFEALAHPYFDELRDPNTRFGKGLCASIASPANRRRYVCADHAPPQLFNWLPGELDEAPNHVVEKIRGPSTN